MLFKLSGEISLQIACLQSSLHIKYRRKSFNIQKIIQFSLKSSIIHQIQVLEELAKQNGVPTCISNITVHKKIALSNPLLSVHFSFFLHPLSISKTHDLEQRAGMKQDSKHWLALSASIKYLCAERKRDRKTELIDTLELIPISTTPGETGYT